MLKNNQQLLHYLGLTLQGVGLLMFASLFLTFISRFGDFSDFDRRMQKQATIVFFRWESSSQENCFAERLREVVNTSIGEVIPTLRDLHSPRSPG